jgi:hypothetical protein
LEKEQALAAKRAEQEAKEAAKRAEQEAKEAAKRAEQEAKPATSGMPKATSRSVLRTRTRSEVGSAGDDVERPQAADGKLPAPAPEPSREEQVVATSRRSDYDQDAIDRVLRKKGIEPPSKK